MPDFFLTFGSTSDKANKFQRISAPDNAAAREVAFHHYGPRWAFMYDEEAFAPQVGQYGLTEVMPPLAWVDAANGEATR